MSSNHNLNEINDMKNCRSNFVEGLEGLNAWRNDASTAPSMAAHGIPDLTSVTQPQIDFS